MLSFKTLINSYSHFVVRKRHIVESILSVLTIITKIFRRNFLDFVFFFVFFLLLVVFYFSSLKYLSSPWFPEEYLLRIIFDHGNLKSEKNEFVQMIDIVSGFYFARYIFLIIIEFHLCVFCVDVLGWSLHSKPISIHIPTISMIHRVCG